MMKRGLLAMMMVMALISCGQKGDVVKGDDNDTVNVSDVGNRQDTLVTDSVDGDEVNEGYSKSLNEIRFEGFTEYDWLNNDYIRALRSYLNEYADTVSDQAQRDLVRSKFVVGYAGEYMLGGMLVYFMFLDSPSDVYSCWVYSDVDEETETVTSYSVRAFKKEDWDSGYTREGLLQEVGENDNLRLW